MHKSSAGLGAENKEAGEINVLIFLFSHPSISITVPHLGQTQQEAEGQRRKKNGWGEGQSIQRRISGTVVVGA